MEPVENQTPPPEAEPELPLATDASAVENEVFAAEFISTAERPASVEDDAQLRAVIEAAIYITDEPLSAQQIAAAIEHPVDVVVKILASLTLEYQRPDRGLTIRELAGGYKMATKPEHHESIRRFVRNLKPPLKLSLAALETLAVIAYKQPVTGPEILEIRGVQGASVLKTLIDRKLIAPAGRKAVVGKPIVYKTTKEFLIQFGLKDLNELPTLKEFEELGRLALADISEELAPEAASAPEAVNVREAASVPEEAAVPEAATALEPAAAAEPRSEG